MRYFDLTPFSNLLHPGLNSIAVALKNTWAVDWDDIAFDLDLKAITGLATSDPSLNISTQSFLGGGAANGASPLIAPQITLNISVAPNTIWRVESADSLSGPWQLVEVVSNTVTASSPSSTTGQNGRPPSFAGAKTLYRLIPD